MQQRHSDLVALLAAAGEKVRDALIIGWRAMIGENLSRYRPEAHYMRGPGPKWRAKHMRES